MERGIHSAYQPKHLLKSQENRGGVFSSAKPKS
jgi:hypothetical protein